MSPALAGRFFTTSATWEAPEKAYSTEITEKLHLHFLSFYLPQYLKFTICLMLPLGTLLVFLLKKADMKASETAQTCDYLIIFYI